MSYHLETKTVESKTLSNAHHQQTVESWQNTQCVLHQINGTNEDILRKNSSKGTQGKRAPGAQMCVMLYSEWCSKFQFCPEKRRICGHLEDHTLTASVVTTRCRALRPKLRLGKMLPVTGVVGVHRDTTWKLRVAPPNPVRIAENTW